MDYLIWFGFALLFLLFLGLLYAWVKGEDGRMTAREYAYRSRREYDAKLAAEVHRWERKARREGRIAYDQNGDVVYYDESGEEVQ